MDEELKGIVQRMIDAKESEENIALVIKSYKPKTEPVKKKESSAPSTSQKSSLELAGVAPSSDSFDQAIAKQPAQQSHKPIPTLDRSLDISSQIKPKDLKGIPKAIDDILTDPIVAEKRKAEEKAYTKDELNKYRQATALTDIDNAEVETELSAVKNEQGIWNTVKAKAASLGNYIAKGAFSKDNPLKTEINEAKLELEKDGIKNPSKEQLETKATEIFTQKKLDGKRQQKINDYISNLDPKAKLFLEVDAEDRFKTLSKESKDLTNRIKMNEKAGLDFIEDLKDPNLLPEDRKAIESQLEVVAKQLDADYGVYGKADSKLGSVKDEFDAFKRNYDAISNFGSRAVSSIAGAAVDTYAGANYIANTLGAGEEDRQVGIKSAKEGLENYQSGFRPDSPEINSDNFFQYATDLIANQSGTILAMSTAGATGGATILGVGAAGQKYSEMYNENKKSVKYTPLQMAVAPLVSGVSEGLLSELPTYRTLRNAGRIFKAAAKDEAGKLLVDEAIKKTASQILKSAGKDMYREVATEEINNVVQNMVNRDILGDYNIGYFDNAEKVLVDTVLMTGIISGIPHVGMAAVKQFTPNKENKILDSNGAKIIELSKQLENENLEPTTRKVIERQISKTTKESAEIVTSTVEKLGKMSEVDVKRVIAGDKKLASLSAKNETIKNDPSLDAKSKQILADGLKEEYKSTQEKTQAIVNGEVKNELTEAEIEERKAVKSEYLTPKDIAGKDITDESAKNLKIIEAHQQTDEMISAAQIEYDKAQSARQAYIKENGYPVGEDMVFDKLVSEKVEAEDKLNQFKKAKENLLPLPITNETAPTNNPTSNGNVQPGNITENVQDGSDNVQPTIDGTESKIVDENESLNFAKEQIKNGVTLWSGNIFMPRIDLGIQWADIRKGEADIARGKENSVPAKRLIEAFQTAKKEGGFRYKEGTGTPNARNQEFFTFEDMQRLINEDALTDAEIEEINREQETLAKEYDEYFNSLDNESQNEIREYGAGNEQSGVAGKPTESRESKENVSNKETTEKTESAKERRKKVADVKIDELADWLKSALPSANINPNDYKSQGFSQEQLIDLIATAVKNLVSAGIEIDVAIKQVIDALKQKFDFDVDINDVKSKISEVPPTKNESKSSSPIGGKNKQAFTTRSFNSENLNTETKAKLEKLGLDYDVESQSQAQDNAEAIIAKLGIVEAYNLAKEGQIRGGARTWIMAQMFEDLNTQINKASENGNTDLVDYLSTELSNIMKTFANEKTLNGQETAMLNRIYNKFGMKYDLEFAKERWKSQFGTEIPVEVEAKLKKQQSEIDTLQKEVKSLEERIGTLEEQDAIENLKDVVRRHNTKNPSSSSLKRAATALRQAKFTKSLSDLSKLQSDPTGVFKGVWDGAIETIATALDAGATIEQAIKKGIDQIKDSHWYKNLSPKSKIEAEKIVKRDFKEFIDEQIAIPNTNANIEQGAVKIPADVIYQLVQSGIDNISDLTDAVHEILADDYPNLTHREVRDAITGYGKQVVETQDDIQKEISRLKTDGKQMSALDDLSDGNRPKRSGRKPKEYTAEQRNRIKQIRELLKTLPVDDSADQSKFYKNALEAYKSRVQNRIKDLSDALDKNKRIINEKRNTVLDAEAEQLVKERDALQKEYDDNFGKPYKSDETLINEIVARKEKSLRDLEVKLASVVQDGKELTRAERRTVTDPKIDDLNKQIEDKRNELNEALEEVGIAESKRLDRGVKYSKRRLAELNTKLANGDFTRRKPKTYKYNRELIELKGKILVAKTKWDIEFEKEQFRQMGYGEKLLEYTYNLFGTFKGLKATADLSAMLRQGVVLGSRNPKEYTKATVDMHKFAFNSKEYKQWMDEL
ncbi:MAG: hypothetical protein KBC56_08120, partial [Flavobacterium sp.]|nr:hypothetical protein [Flavobacterium sp.]